MTTARLQIRPREGEYIDVNINGMAADEGSVIAVINALERAFGEENVTSGTFTDKED